MKYKIYITAGKYYHRITCADFIIGFIHDIFFESEIYGFIMGRFFIGITREWKIKE